MQPIREALRNLPDAVFADLLESSDAYLLVLDLPGVKKEGVTVNAYERRLEIEASREKTVPRGFEYLDEERSLFLDTTVPLPMDAVAEDATATLEDGILEITIPRAEHTGRDIPIEG
jgi:HSP20 family molecular chaperone IbpA